MSSTEFYNNFVSYQVKSGINDRIFGLYKRLKKLGLNANSCVLEIGCGIGSLTYLLSHIVKKGKVEAMDISPRSIEYAKKHLSKPNISFASSDILDYSPRSSGFDFVLLFDVLEHVPEKDHLALFTKIRNWMVDGSRLMINLPNPGYILYDQKNNPATLQETDQPIFFENLAGVISKALLEINYFETYSVWVKNDYHFIIVQKKKDFQEILLSNEHNFFEKGVIRLQREVRKILYKYPV